MRTEMRRSLVEILRRMGGLEAAFRIHESLETVNPRTLYRNARHKAGLGPDSIPLPPVGLMTMVVGHSDIQAFVEGGRRAKESIVDTLARNGLDVLNFEAILDFGCGCGRVIRHWCFLQPSVLFGTDYNPRLVEWCRTHLTFAQFDTNQLSPPLAYGRDEFDLVYALSVFTHLPEHLQHQWVDEFRRILKPGGYLLITTHGEHYLNILTQGERRDFEAGQLVVRYQELAGTNMCSTFHPEEYVKYRLMRGFVIVDFASEGAKGNPFQDIYLLKKPAA